jgi:hypothetical protein
MTLDGLSCGKGEGVGVQTWLGGVGILLTLLLDVLVSLHILQFMSVGSPSVSIFATSTACHH